MLDITVSPVSIKRVELQSLIPENKLLPGYVFEEFILEVGILECFSMLPDVFLLLNLLYHSFLFIMSSWVN